MSVRVGVIGTGWADRVLIPAFQAGGLEVAAVASHDAERAKAVAQRHGIERATTDWRDLLELDLDLVAVTTPPAQHVERAIAVLEAGLHLLCEKPVGLDAAGAGRLLAAAEARPEQLALVNHELRFTPALRKARELVRSGAIGRPVMYTARVATSACIDPTRRWSWWADARQGGGMLQAHGSHVFDSVAWIADEPLVVHGATLGRLYDTLEDEHGVQRHVTSDDIASVTFRVGDAVGTLLVHGGALDDAIDLFTIRGTEGSVVIDRSLKLYYGKRGGPLKEYRTTLPSMVSYRFRASGFDVGSVLAADAIRRRLEDDDTEALQEAADLRAGVRVRELLDEAKRQHLERSR